MKYGARHLKRAIERLLVQPMSNLIATDQVRGGDWISVDFDANCREMRFVKEAEGVPVHTMADLAATSISVPAMTLGAAALHETAGPSHRAGSSKRS